MVFRNFFLLLFAIICSGGKYMNYSEIKQAVKMLSSEWNLGKKKAKADNDVCTLTYLIVIL